MKKGRVLVVDDEPAVRSWLAALLTHEGYLVEEAADGAEGLEVLKRFLADVIVLDLIMPGMNGRQFLLELREDPKLAGTPVLVWTAVKGVHINLTTLGATEVLEKLPDPDEMLRKIALAAYRSEPRASTTVPPFVPAAVQPETDAPQEVVIVLDAVRDRWPRRIRELGAGGFNALPRIEPMPKVLRLARAVDAVAVLVERSAIIAEPSLSELFAGATAAPGTAQLEVREFDASQSGIEGDLLSFLHACMARRRLARAH
jgi:DNA-binding response OmpR family regulator